ncbi:hypothetical protein EBZ38_12745 [bacterium]|nr:hypothetical protein [bacterium]
MINEPVVAWAVMQPDSYSVFVSYDKAVAHRNICAGGDIIPLYRQPNLTDKEIDEWRNAAMKIGEKLSSTGPDDYYNFTPQQWFEWANSQIEKNRQ